MEDGGSLATILSLLTALFFSINAVLIRKGVVRAQPIHGALITGLIGVAVSVVLSFGFREFHSLLELNYSSIFWAALAGLVNMALGRWLWYSGIKIIGAARTATLDNSSVIYSVIGAVVFLNESITLRLGSAISAIIIGTYLVTKGEGARHADGRITSTRERIIGVILALSSSFFYGIGAVVNKVALDATGSPLTAYFIATTSASLVIILAITLGSSRRQLLTLSRSDVRTLGFAGLAHNMGTFFQYAALFIAPVVFVIPVVRAYPLITILLSILVLQRVERVNGYVVIGAVITIAGIYGVLT